MNFNPRLRTRFCMSDSVTLLATFAKSFVIGIVVIIFGMVIIVRMIVIRMYIDCLRCGLSQFLLSTGIPGASPMGALTGGGEDEVLGTCIRPTAQPS